MGNKIEWRECRRVIVFGWHDGYEEGVFSIQGSSREFWFEIIAARQNGHEDERFFLLHELSSGTITEMLNLLKPLGVPSGTVWIPKWDHADKTLLTTIEKEIDQLRRLALDSRFVILADNDFQFKKIWKLTTKIGDGSL